jgi:hypothetical protein
MSWSRYRRRGYFRDVDTVASLLAERYGDHSHGNKANPLRELIFIICSVATNETLYRSTFNDLMVALPSFRHEVTSLADTIALDGLYKMHWKSSGGLMFQELRAWHRGARRHRMSPRCNESNYRQG